MPESPRYGFGAGRSVVIATIVCAAVAVAAPAATAASKRDVDAPRVAAGAVIGVGRVVVVRGAVRPVRTGARAQVQRRGRGRWIGVARTVRVDRRGRFVARWKPARGIRLVTLRVALTEGKRRRTASKPFTLHLAPNGSSAFSVPATTRLYGSGAIASVTAGARGVDAVVTLTPGSQRPVMGGHVAIAPVSDLPYGMFAKVVAARLANSRWTVALKRAALDEVLDNVSIGVDKNVVPTVVDAAGRPLPATDRGRFAIRGTAAFGSARAAAFGSVFTCRESGGAPRTAEDVWERTGLPFPVEVKLEHTHVTHRFYAGSIFPRADPFLLLQFRGEAVASIGFKAKTGFKCELSNKYRESHRFQIPVGELFGIPVTIYLEPMFKFEVSAAGKVELSQRHYFAITLQKDGFAPLGVKIAHSTDPVSLTSSAAVDASFFAGGDLSLMFGGGYKYASASAGIYGAFGPKFRLAASSDKPGCLTATANLEADLGVRLQLLVRRWNLEVARLTTRDAALGGPWCVDKGGDTAGTSMGSSPAPHVTITPSSGPVGTSVSLRGTDFGRGELVSVRFDDSELASAQSAGDGSISSVAVQVPSTASIGLHQLLVVGHTSGRSAAASFTVVDPVHAGLAGPIRVASTTADGTLLGPYLGEPAWSPDGAHIAFVGSGPNTPPQVYVKDLASGVLDEASATSNGSQLQYAIAPLWSPDGHRIAFQAGDDTVASGLFIKDLRDGTLRVASTTAAGSPIDIDTTPDAEHPVWSPDGTKVAFEGSGASPNAQLYAKDLQTGTLTVVSSASDGTPSSQQPSQGRFTWSPDSTRIAFESSASNLVPGVAGVQVYVKDLRTGAITLATAATDGEQISSNSTHPTWSPQGNQLAFVSDAAQIPGLPGQRYAYPQVYVKDLSSGALTLVSADATGAPSLFGSALPMWSPHGGRLAFIRYTSDPLDHCGQLAVTAPPFGSFTYASTAKDGTLADSCVSGAAWDPNGGRLSFLTSADLANGSGNFLYIKVLATGDVLLPASTSDGIPGPQGASQATWSSDGAQLAFLSQSALVPGVPQGGFGQIYVKTVG